MACTNLCKADTGKFKDQVCRVNIVEHMVKHVENVDMNQNLLS